MNFKMIFMVIIIIIENQLQMTVYLKILMIFTIIIIIWSLSFIYYQAILHSLQRKSDKIYNYLNLVQDFSFLVCFNLKFGFAWTDENFNYLE